MKTKAESTAYRIATRQLKANTFISVHQCTYDVLAELIWKPDKQTIKTEIHNALQDYGNSRSS